MSASDTPIGRSETATASTALSADLKLGSASETIVIATFANRQAAEKMLLALGRDFRKMARKAGVAAFLITGNADGSFSVVQSRVLTASGVVAAGVGVAVASVAGLMGIMSAIRGGKEAVHAARDRETHISAEAQRIRDILAEAGTRGAVAVIRCADPEVAADAVTLAAERARDSWHGSRAEVVAGLGQSADDYDWLLRALEEHPSPTASG